MDPMGIEVQVKVHRFGNDGFVFKKDGSIILESWDFGLFLTLLVLAWWKVILLSVVYMDVPKNRGGPQNGW